MELAGPDGGAQVSPPKWVAGPGLSWRSSRARGPVGGAFGASGAGGGRTEPNMGAEGASGGVMALTVDGAEGSLATEPCRSTFGRTLRSVVSRGSRGGSRFGKSSRSSRGPSRKRGSGWWMSRSSRSRGPQRPWPSCDRSLNRGSGRASGRSSMKGRPRPRSHSPRPRIEPRPR